MNSFIQTIHSHTTIPSLMQWFIYPYYPSIRPFIHPSKNTMACAMLYGNAFHELFHVFIHSFMHSSILPINPSVASLLRGCLNKTPTFFPPSLIRKQNKQASKQTKLTSKQTNKKHKTKKQNKQTKHTHKQITKLTNKTHKQN